MIGRGWLKHLHNQLAIPMLVGAAVVAILATIIGSRIVSQPIEDRMRGNLENSAKLVHTRFGQEIARLREHSKFAAESPRLEVAIESGDLSELVRVVVPMRNSLGVDYLAIVRPDGTVWYSLGEATFSGRDLARTRLVRFGTFEMNAAGLVPTRSGPSLAAIATIRDPEGPTAFLVAGRMVNRRFLASLLDRPDVPITLLDRDGHVVATTVGPKDHRLLPIRNQLAQARRRVTGSTRPVTRSLGTGEGVFLAAYAPLMVEGDDIGTIEAIQSGADVVELKRRTTTLVAWWSVAAVLGLVGLDFYIARRVSAPIQRIAGSARQVASGDLSPTIEFHDGGEVGELASSFNTMTASLRAKTEALTKQLTELLVFYDMSKAFGTTLKLDELLNVILDSARDVLQADSGYVALVDRESGVLEVHARRGAAAQGDSREEVSRSVGRLVIQTGRPLLFGDDIERDLASAADGQTPRSAVCVPLQVKDRVIGIIVLSHSAADAQFTEESVRVLSTMAGNAAVAVENAQLFESLEQAYMGTVRALAAAIEAKDPYTQGHSAQVAWYCMLLADEIGLSEQDRSALETAAYLHDIGKIGVRDEVLLKPSQLSNSEMNEIRRHSMISANILRPVPFPWQITPIVRHHHERWDGGGYPAGLKGNEIPQMARMLALADAFHAIISERPYRRSMTNDEAIAELKECSGTQFDPELVPPFIRAVEAVVKLEATERELAGPPASTEFEMGEVRAIFVSLANGIMDGFRGLGGPRVAAELESELNEYFDSKGYPAKFENGLLVVQGTPGWTLQEELELCRHVLEAECSAIQSQVGSGIIARFYKDALEGMSARYQTLAGLFGLSAVPLEKADELEAG